MAGREQGRFNNQRPDFLSAREAARFLRIKLPTLYSYVSRGLLRSVPGERGKRYLRADLERLKARHDARSGHGPVAAAALRWGEPVLESALTCIGPKGPAYRGHCAVDLAREGVSFEAVAELLWGGVLPAAPPLWKAHVPRLSPERIRKLLPARASPLAAFPVALSLLGASLRDESLVSEEAERERARGLILYLTGCLSSGGGRRLSLPRDGRVASLLAAALSSRAQGAHRINALNQALILCADHELNPSSFAARVAASAGADLYACLGAALSVFLGDRHGGASSVIERLLKEIRRPAQVAEWLGPWEERGLLVPGFGHPLYPAGDPRAALLLDMARDLAPRSLRVRALLALCEAVRERWGEAPTLDMGLVALSRALGLPDGAASVIFAIGRFAGWVAHILEQRQAGFLLRPRARYVAPASTPCR